MSDQEDRLNWIKNLIQMMCCDRDIDKSEKEFLFKAARQLQVEVDDWNGLLKRVLKDERIRYPIEDEAMAIAALKSLVLMASADNDVKEVEKQYILRFAKMIGVTNSHLKTIVKEIDVKTLFRPFRKMTGNIAVLKEDFDKIEDFKEVAQQNDKTVSVMTFEEFLADSQTEDIVCFHASGDRVSTVQKCGMLLEKSGDKVISILNRYQGHQVKYMLEIGLRKCVIEPVYSRDIDDIFSID